ncbi:sensor histidine kinase [Aestuariibaculum suncheonense]|uniref:Histidine kinase n=1 Tax=Aestuariibaculum suncheonense TaxID=1028745 RepID=A0A8J6UBW1_9FLAO|nr:histidine kinase [Aestuariibaculum suncheonense]MBD0836638.1 histidine kinase [Aestuariibaculum suncheonense]
MKKIIILLLFAGLLKLNAQEEIRKMMTDTVWEKYVQFDKSSPFYKTFWFWTKERIFNGVNRDVIKFSSDISIQLKNSFNENDSIIICNLIQELKGIIPNNINFSTQKKGNVIIEIVANGTRFGSRSKIGKSGIIFKEYQIGFNDSDSFESRKRILEFFVIRSLCGIQNVKYRTKTGYAIFDDFDPDPVLTKFSLSDRFLLQKLYSKDLLKEAKSYILSNYTKRYYLNFFYKNEMKFFGVILSVLITFLIFIFSYRRVFRRRYRVGYLNYLMPGMVLMFTSYIGINLYDYLTSSGGLGLYLYSWFVTLIVYIPICLIVLSLLYVLEKNIINKEWTIAKQLKLKIIFTFLVIITIIVLMFVFNSDNKFNFIISLIGIVVFSIRTAFLYLREQTEIQLRKKDIELSKMKALKAQAEVASLNARINPHFLYNSLNSIVGLVRSNPEKTEQMALSLSDLFRYNINRNNTLSSTIKEEIEAVRAYLQIEQIRFGDRMKFSIEVDESIEQFEIPRNIIQPLVENAIKHGVSKIKHEGIIKVKIQKNNEVVEISVSDNGPDFPEGVITGYGLQSINDILKLSYEGEGELHWENEPAKRIWITISEKGFNNMKRFINEAV